MTPFIAMAQWGREQPEWVVSNKCISVYNFCVNVCVCEWPEEREPLCDSACYLLPRLSLFPHLEVPKWLKGEKKEVATQAVDWKVLLIMGAVSGLVRCQGGQRKSRRRSPSDNHLAHRKHMLPLAGVLGIVPLLNASQPADQCTSAAPALDSTWLLT